MNSELKRALSSREIYEKTKDKCRTIPYKILKGYDNIYDLFEDYGNCIILHYQTKKNYGHFTLLINHPDYVEHFDSLGYLVDDQLNVISKLTNKKLDQEKPYLVRLLYKSGKMIKYNEFPFQKDKKDISTCGRWCIIRANLKDIDLDEFQDIFNDLGKHMDLDKFSVYLTEN